MTNQNKVLMLSFFAGFQAYHALIHAYLGLTGTKVKGHPIGLLGIKVDSKLHTVATIANAAIAVGLGAKALNFLNEPNISADSKQGVRRRNEKKYARAQPLSH